MAQPAKKIFTIIEDDKYTGGVNKVRGAVDKLVDFIKPTLGPKIRHVLVDFGYKTELMDDGVSIAREFELEDEFENAVVAYVKEVSQRTDDKAGDGTTTTMVLLQALLREMQASGKAYPEMKDELEASVASFCEYLKKETKIVESEEELYRVAKTSMNDETVARMIAKIVWEIGPNGAVSITDHTLRDTIYERLEGFSFGRGFLARGMINNKDKQLYEAPNKNFPGAVGIAVVEETIATQDQIVPILEAAEIRGVKNIAIFCPNVIGEALGVIALNQMRGAFNIVAVPFPGQGEKQKDFAGDICTITGASTPIGRFGPDNLGIATSVTASKDDTTIVGGEGDKALINAHIQNLQELIEMSKDDYEKEYFHLRQARLKGGVVVIKVGGVTETEIRLKLKKVEDAVNACRCALEEGIVPGAGVTLANFCDDSGQILTNAISAPLSTLIDNAGYKGGLSFDEKQTIDVLTGKTGDYLDIGVVDATKVLRTAVENAASIATILYSVSGIITTKTCDNQKS